MKVLPKAKQVRFAQLVKAAGRPRSATLWTEPSKDREFKKAMDENRVVTVTNVNVGTKKDRGIIGFLEGRNSTYLVFPKELPMAEGTGVIGLKFEELADEPVEDPVRVKSAARKKKNEKVRTEKTTSRKKEPREPAREPEPTQSIFRVRVAFTATVLKEIEVEAGSASEALDSAEKKAKQEPPTAAPWKVEGLEVKKMK